MKSFWFIKSISSCILIALVVSCAPHTYKKASVTTVYEQPIQSYFFSKDSVHYFKTSIDTYGKSLSGILAVRRLNVDTLKVSFFTEVGVTFFDAIVTHDSYQLIRCIPQLDSKGVMNTIIEDIRWVVLFNLNQLTDPVLIKTSDPAPIVRSNYQDVFIFTELSKDNLPLLVTYVYGSKFKSKFDIRYDSFENSIPNKIFVRHYNIDLKIDLTAISFSQ
ncbi:hypothetical protein [Cytophaga aurantiaca]|uniref:hypothetical protein n=1 Tax=Cytophaga aurantiaca TaxID=29530 RepID=UPI0003601CFF|nr:hypothetical protein [Cytophaga aurantiaca]